MKELEETLDNTRQALLRLRGPHGHWEGELAASALSTATAVVALETYLRAGSCSSEVRSRKSEDKGRLPTSDFRPLTSDSSFLRDRGRDWLARTQNGDGGWGDTILSLSNISTTALCFAAFAGADEKYPEVVRRCAAYLEKAANGLEPEALATMARTARFRCRSLRLWH